MIKIWRRFKRWILAVLGITGATIIVVLLTGPIPIDLQLKAEKDAILLSQEIDWISCDGKDCENKGKIIKYDYRSDIEVQNAKGEDVSKRTGNSRFFKWKEEDDKETWTQRSFAGTPFIFHEQKWYKTKTATTTIDAFNEQTKISFFEKLLGQPVFAVATTSYVGAGDGDIQHADAAGHDACRASVNGTSADAVGGNGDNSPWHYDASGTVGIRRVYFPVYTAIPATASVTTSTLFVYTGYTENDDNDGYDYMVVLESFQASHTTLGVSDYVDCGYGDGGEDAASADDDNIVDGSQQLDITGISAEYNEWVLNSTGRGWIKASGESSTCGSALTGWTCLCIRMGNDAGDHPITTGPSIDNGVNVIFSENGSNEPYLEITYSTAVAEQVVPWIPLW